MKRLLLYLSLSPVLLAASASDKPTIYDFNMPDINGRLLSFSQYKAKVLLIVNVASASEFTPQYRQLEALYEKYHSAGLEILAFPSNDFGGQESDTEAAIKSFAASTYHVTFPLFAKISVRGDDVTPLFHYLSKEASPKAKGDVHWNFTKFLVDRKGKLTARFEPDVAPDDPELIVALEKALTDSGANSQEQPTSPQSEVAEKKRPRSDE